MVSGTRFLDIIYHNNSKMVLKKSFGVRAP